MDVKRDSGQQLLAANPHGARPPRPEQRAAEASNGVLPPGRAGRPPELVLPQALRASAGNVRADGGETKRRNLHDFLREARARVDPRDLGLTPPANRRGTGLQQADLATALNVSPRWYNGFENGAVEADESTLDQLAQHLRLTGPERVYLYLLARGHEPAPGAIEPPSDADAVLKRMVLQVGNLAVPALVTDIAWNLLAWNHALTTWLPGPDTRPTDARNAMLWAFTDEASELFEDVAFLRLACIGWVHLALAAHPGNPNLACLAERLQEIPAARDLWSDHQVTQFTNSLTTVRLRQPTALTLVEADVLSMEFPGSSRLVMLVPRRRCHPTQPPALTLFTMATQKMTHGD